MHEKLSIEIKILQEISNVLVWENDSQVLLDKIIEILERELGMLRGTFTLIEGSELKIAASAQELNAEEKALGRYGIGEGVTGTVAKTGKAEIIPDVRKDKRFLNKTGARPKGKAIAFICVPIIRHGQIIGTLSVDRNVGKNASFDLEKDAALLSIIANIVGEAAAVRKEQREEREKLINENKKLRNMLIDNPGNLIGNCQEMRVVYEQIRQVAQSDVTVLIRGASGTGKELVARAIQSLSSRKDNPFVIVNCASLPENLIESELFGHEKGSFTGAFERRIGRAEEADGGTLFLDEIGDLSLPMQVKILRLLQERTFSRLGSNAEIRSNVRFIAATSRDLEELMSQNRFREDLYYRLCVFPITLPDLSRRYDDIMLLAKYFLEKFNLKYSKNISAFSTAADSNMRSYSWPGNVRELENCVERAVLTAKDNIIHTYDLPKQIQREKYTDDPYQIRQSKTLNEQIGEAIKVFVKNALDENGGSQKEAARSLGISSRMINYYIKRYKVK
ncbi:sigma 54-interacting transcriptional regulator [bacterium]|nr:sigma 54-interacting transcriptional regulator [bacterium]